MTEDNKQLYIGTSIGDEKQYLNFKLANRHGLIAGATGTGKTVSLQILTEGFSNAGVPVFCADVKGDLSGLAAAGVPKDFLTKRANKIGLGDYPFEACPTIFWDLYGEKGHPIRTTMNDMGSLLLSNLLDLNDTQEGVLNIAFRVAREEKMPVLDMKDMRTLLNSIGERSKEMKTKYGNVSKSSIGAIQRRLLVLEDEGGQFFFGEPALDIMDFMRTTFDGKGFVNILAADKLMQSPKLYATFLVWLLNELFEVMPEVGDPDKPKMVFFFDEAHLLFDDAPRALIQKVEQVVRLIRSKGVGIYFVTQNPQDVPDSVSGQLGNRIQHALRAFTPRERKAVRVAAETFRQNPDLDTVTTIMELGVGEALVSTLEEKGRPSMVQHTLVRPPASRLGPLTAEERASLMKKSPVAEKYDKLVDRNSAHEMILKRSEERAETRAEIEAMEASTKPKGRQRQTATQAFFKSMMRSLGTNIARAIAKAIFGGRR